MVLWLGSNRHRQLRRYRLEAAPLSTELSPSLIRLNKINAYIPRLVSTDKFVLFESNFLRFNTFKTASKQLKEKVKGICNAHVVLTYTEEF